MVCALTVSARCLAAFSTASPHLFSQNVGLVSVTGVHSRWVCVASGAILIIFGMVPKMAVLVASIPQFVLGGAGLVMFGMVLATGSHSGAYQLLL